MKKTLAILFAAFTLFIFAYGCSKKAPDSPVVAEVNDEPITQNDFIKELGRVPEWARDQFKEKEGRDKFLDELIKREMIYQNALKMRLNKDKEYIEKVKDFEKISLVSLSLKKEVDDKVRIDESEIKAFYDNNKDKFTIGTKIKASHILVKTEDEANDIYEKLYKGESFASMAKKYSIDTGSSANGGDLGYFGRGKMVPEFESAALSLKPGEISKPVKSRFGYHIIKLTDIKKGTPATYEQSKDAIRRELINQKRKVLFDAYIERLKQSSNINKHEDILSSIVLPWENKETPQNQPEQAHSETGK